MPTGQQLQIERERALDHESTIEELKERITSLQQLQAHQQVAHGQQIDALLAQIRDAQAQVAEASQQKKKAETKCLTARKQQSLGWTALSFLTRTPSIAALNRAMAGLFKVCVVTLFLYQSATLNKLGPACSLALDCLALQVMR